MDQLVDKSQPNSPTVIGPSKGTRHLAGLLKAARYVCRLLPDSLPSVRQLPRSVGLQLEEFP